jgi:hypothetical protein
MPPEIPGPPSGRVPVFFARVRGLHALEIAQRAPALGRARVGAQLLIGERRPPVIAAEAEEGRRTLEHPSFDLGQGGMGGAGEQGLGDGEAYGAQLVGLRAA